MPDPSLPRVPDRLRLPGTDLSLLHPALPPSEDFDSDSDKTRLLSPTLCDNFQCDKTPQRSLFPSSHCSSPCSSPEDLCRHSYYDCCVKVTASKLLEHWLDSPNVQETPHKLASFPESLLQSDNPLLRIRKFFSEEVSLSDNPRGENLLHLVISKYCHLPCLPLLVRLLVNSSPGDTSLTDNHGDTSLTMVRHILEAGHFHRAHQVASLLLEHGAHPDHQNECGWSLLAYSLTYQDQAIQLTRSLLNHGATVLPSPSSISVASSPLRVFLSSLVRTQSLDKARESLALLGQVMGRHPTRMKTHVISSMVAEGRFSGLNTPVIFQEVQESLAPYWVHPPSLLHLSFHATRRKLGLKRLNCGKLPLAPRLANYLSYKLTLHSPLSSLSRNSQDSSTQKTEPKQYQQEDVLSEHIRQRLATAS